LGRKTLLTYGVDSPSLIVVNTVYAGFTHVRRSRVGCPALLPVSPVFRTQHPVNSGQPLPAEPENIRYLGDVDYALLRASVSFFGAALLALVSKLDGLQKFKLEIYQTEDFIGLQ
jgi:hypothetical protein